MDEKKCCGTCGFWRKDDKTHICTKLIVTSSAEIVTAAEHEVSGKYLRTASVFYCIYWKEIPRMFTIRLTPDADDVCIEVITPRKTYSLGTFCPSVYTLEDILRIIRSWGIVGKH